MKHQTARRGSGVTTGDEARDKDYVARGEGVAGLSGLTGRGLRVFRRIAPPSGAAHLRSEFRGPNLGAQAASTAAFPLQSPSAGTAGLPCTGTSCEALVRLPNFAASVSRQSSKISY